MAIQIEWLNAEGSPIQHFIGTDIELVFTIYNDDETAVLDINGWALSFMVKRHLGDQDEDAAIEKTVGAGITVSGAWSGDPEQNLQVATVTLEDVDTDSLKPGIYRCELKRMDPGLEVVLAYGTFPLVRGVHRS